MLGAVWISSKSGVIYPSFHVTRVEAVVSLIEGSKYIFAVMYPLLVRSQVQLHLVYPVSDHHRC